MNRHTRLLAIIFTASNVIFMTNTYAGPEITGIPREPADKAKMEKMRLSTQLCGPGWTLSNDRAHTPASFLCVPIKPQVHCPANTQLLETDYSIGCIPKPN